jgi:tRNA(fMet)-specific endonuclease VapC
MMSVHPSDIKIPAVVKAELLYGAEKSTKRNENISKATAFLMPFEIVPFDDDASVCYSAIRAFLEKAGTPIGPNDLLIAAITKARGAVLVTNNMKEYERIPEIQLENWIE